MCLNGWGNGRCGEEVMISWGFLIMQEMIWAGSPPCRPRLPVRPCLFGNALNIHIQGLKGNRATDKRANTMAAIFEYAILAHAWCACLFDSSRKAWPQQQQFYKKSQWCREGQERERERLRGRPERRRRCFITLSLHHINLHLQSIQSVRACVCVRMCFPECSIAGPPASLNISSLPACI